MRKSLFPLIAYLRYWLLKEDRYSQQSPFVFRLYSSLLAFIVSQPKGNSEIEAFRKKLLNDRTGISVQDWGAGSKRVPKAVRQIRHITRYSTSSYRFALLYQYFCSLTPAQTVLELGTCVGISTRYLAQATRGNLHTFEGAEHIQKVALSSPMPDHVHFTLGKIEEQLPALLRKIKKVDFVLIDANHSYAGTTAYFSLILPLLHPKSIVAIGDIHWSSGMEQAWEEIKSNDRIRLSMDFYECGILLLDNPGPLQHLVLDI